MNASLDESLVSEVEAKAFRRGDVTWRLAKWFAAAGFLAGGCLAFAILYRDWSPPPPPPGTAACGNSVLGGYLVGLFRIVIGTPTVAVLSGIAAAAFGGTLDCLLCHRRQTRLAREDHAAVVREKAS